MSAERSPALHGFDATDQAGLDRVLIDLDGTPNKGRLGGNALIAVSMAAAHASAAAAGLPLWRYLGGDAATLLPLPEIQIFGGGAHARERIDIQDFMIVCPGAGSFAEACEWTAEVYRAAGLIMEERGTLQGIADEGGYWPAFGTNEEGLELLVRAIERAGYVPGEQIAISLDIASTEFGKDGKYRIKLEDRELTTEGMIEMLLGWVDAYPILSIEDPLAEDDPEGMAAFMKAVRGRVQVVGDDFLVTNADRVARGPRARGLRRPAGQAQPGRHPDRDQGGFRRRPRGRLGHAGLGPLGRDRGRDDHPSGGRLGGAAVQGRVVCPLGAHVQMERGNPHRGCAGRSCPLRRRDAAIPKWG